MADGSSTQPPFVSATRLSRRFGPRLAVDDVSLDVTRGRIVALLGPNGAGKTTTMRMLAGLLRPDAGTITLDGVPVGDDTAPLRARVGLLTETPGLWDRLSIADNLLVHARLHGLAAPAAAVGRALARLGLAARAGDRAGTLSKGMKQKVALARALLHAPALVLLDEPTSGLDPEMARSVRDHVRDLRADGCAIVLASHNLDEVERLADTVVVINTRVVADGPPAGLRARARHGATAVVRFAAPFDALDALAERHPGGWLEHGGRQLRVPLGADAARMPALVRDLVALDAQVEGISVDQPALEDAYLALVRDTPEGA